MGNINSIGVDKMTFFKKLKRELNKPTLERQFLNEVRLRKEVNSEHIWAAYYIPLAAKEIIKETGTLTKDDKYRMEMLANSLMFKDMADSKLTDLYRFKEVENEA